MPQQITLIGVNVDVIDMATKDDGTKLLVIQDKQLPQVWMIECSPEMCDTIGGKLLEGRPKGSPRVEVVRDLPSALKR